MQYGFFFDQNRCIGCNACTVSCKDYYDVNPGPVRWRNQQAHETVTGTAPVFSNVSMSCNHCADPACVKACAFGVLVKRQDGIVVANRAACQGDRGCIDACPFGATHIANDQQEPTTQDNWANHHPVQKCSGCFERVAEGKQPVCVAACPTRALDFGNVQVARDGYTQINKNDFSYLYKNDNDKTGPSFYIKKRKAMAVTEQKI